MKLRFTSLDLRVIAHELQTTLHDHRLTNIYDVSPRVFQLKFHTSTSKQLLLIDSGFRAHLSSFSRTTLPSPSPFISKLRKHLKTRRLSCVKQVGTDRVLQLDFTDGLYRLFVEFFSGGNVILTDKEFKILAVLRVVVMLEKDVEGNVVGTKKIAVGEVYDYVGKDVEGVTIERLKEALEFAAQEDEKEDVVEEEKKDEEAVTTKSGKGGKGKQQKQQPQKKKKKKVKKDDRIKAVLGLKFTELSPTLIEHLLMEASIDPVIKAGEVLKDDALCDKLLEALQGGEKMLAGLTEAKPPLKGYIIAKKPVDKHASSKPDDAEKKPKKAVKFGGEFDEPSSSTAQGETGKTAEELAEQEAEEEEEVANVVPNQDKDGYLYDEYYPFAPVQFKDKDDAYHILEVDGFNNTVDKFYSSIEAQKLSSRIDEKKAQAAKRLEHARKEHETRVESLHQLQELHIIRAEAIENNAEQVDEAIAAVNGLVARGMDWGDIANLIDREKARQNPVARFIHSLKLSENTIVLEIPNDYEEEEDEEGDETASEKSDDDEEEGDNAAMRKSAGSVKVDVLLNLTAYANARNYYESKRAAAVKQTKTLQSSEKALKNTEKRIQADLRKGLKAEKMELRNLRKQGWWEKFFWFKSSEGYLVLGARDATQTEMLYKKYFKRGDIYVHADSPGSCHVVVKNNPLTAKDPIPPATLSQAGTLAVCTSRAWDNKQVMSAWWVDYDQVSKVGAGGQVLPIGELAFKGDKKWLPPAMLVMGFAIGWVAKKAESAEGDDEEGDGDMNGKVDGDAEAEEAKGEEEDEKEEEDSDDEEFPDTKLESANEEEETADGKQDDSDDEGEFPDTQIEETKEAKEPPSETPEAPVEAVESMSIADDADDTGSHAAAHKHLSAKEKRDMKKSKTKAFPSSSTPTDSRSSTPSQKDKLSSQSQQQVKVRGKKSKQKKMKEKYADQSDSEREEALRLLGSAAPVTAGSGTATPQQQPSQPKISAAQQALIEKQERQRAQAAKQAEKTLADEKNRKENAENYLDFEADYSPDSTLLMSDLGGILPSPPVEEGEVEVIPVPVCAPWSALQKYTWKAKIQPGNDKKGKATREIVERWLRIGEKDVSTSTPKKKRDNNGNGNDKEKEKEVVGMRPKEKELVKAWKGAELAQAVPVSKMKVMMTGGGLDKGDSNKGKGGKKDYEERDGGKGKGGKGGGGGGGEKGSGKKGKK